MLLVNTFRELTYFLVPSLCEFYLSLFVHMVSKEGVGSLNLDQFNIQRIYSKFLYDPLNYSYCDEFK